MTIAPSDKVLDSRGVPLMLYPGISGQYKAGMERIVIAMNVLCYLKDVARHSFFLAAVLFKPVLRPTYIFKVNSSCKFRVLGSSETGKKHLKPTHEICRNSSPYAAAHSEPKQ